MFIIDDLALGVSGSLIAAAVQRGLKKSDQEKYDQRLRATIYKTVDEFSKENPISEHDGKYPFYQSEIIVSAILSQRLFKNLDANYLLTEFKKDNRVTTPLNDEIVRFVEIFEEYFAADEDLINLGIEAQYKGEIFITSEKVDRNYSALIEILNILQNRDLTKPVKLLTEIPSIDPSEVIGREKELKEITKLLKDERKVVLINGIGGIGKTTVAKLFTEIKKNKYDHLAWIDGTDTLPNGIMQAKGLLQNLNIGSVEKTDPETVSDRVLNELRNMGGNNLLIIDNAKESLKNYAKGLPGKPNWQVLITSREKLAPFKEYRLDTLSPIEAKELFRAHYVEECDEKDLEDLLEYIGYHTLTIELLAKTLTNSIELKHIKDLTNYLKENKLDQIGIEIETEYSEDYTDIYSHLINAFKLAGLTGDELLILKQLSIIPSEELSGELILDLTCHIDEGKTEKTNTLNTLVKKGWIESKTKNVFKVHHIIQEVTRYETKPTADDYEPVISAIASLLSLDQAKDNPIDKFIWVPFGDSICNSINYENQETDRLINNLALRHSDMGQYNKAAELLEPILISNIKNHGEDHPKTAIRKSNLALIYKHLGNYKKAVELLEMALESNIKNFGEEDPRTTIRRSNLAVVYKDLGDYDKAVELLEIALKSDIKNFGESHSRVSTRRSNLAIVYKHLGNYNKAVELLEMALKSDIRNFGEDHPKTAIRKSNLAIVYKDIGQYIKAAELLESALKFFIKNLGEKHPKTALLRSNLSIMYKYLGKYDKAVELCEIAHNSDLENFGKDSPITAISKSNLAGIYWELHQETLAKELFIQAYNTLYDKLGVDHPNTKTVKEHLDTKFGEENW